MKETELAEKFINFFGNEFQIYKEVPAMGFIDFVVKNENVTMAVEVKKTLNFNVIEQANRNKNYCDYSYIAIPSTKSQHFGYTICEMLGIGVLVYTKNNQVYEQVKPKKNRKSKYYKLNLEPYMMRSVAGSQNNRMTPFKVTIENMVKYIKRHPNCTLNECLNNIDFHWNNISSAKNCVYLWIKRGIITEFNIEKGKLVLNKIDND